MAELLTAAQMRAIEQAAIESGVVTGLELMERAGRGVVEAIFEEWPELAKTSHRAVVLCGPGNNGGDGFVVARLLKEWGWEVEVFLYGDPEKLPRDAKVNYERWSELGSTAALTESAFRDVHPVHGRSYADIYIDALFGTGLTKPVRDEAKDVLTHMSGRNGDNYTPYTVAIDAPSGLCLDSGRVLGVQISEDHDYRGKAAAAVLTVAFDSPKVGHFTGFGPTVCGKLVIKDIGLTDWRATQPIRGKKVQPMRRGGMGRAVRPARTTIICRHPMVKDLRSQWDRFRWQMLNKSRRGSHKYSFGHALILSGGPGKTGAARLTARGALRIGAGLVTLGVPPSAQMEVASQVTALMLRRVEGADELIEVLEDRRLNAICLGPGFGTGEREQSLIAAALGAKRRTVLDADALTALAADQTLFGKLHDACVLTPHAGEFERLFPDIYERLEIWKTPVGLRYSDYDPKTIQQKMAGLQKVREKLATEIGPAYSKVDATREAAKRAGCVVLYKGPDSVIASPDGRCSINSAQYERAAPWLATAGSGDVLAGFITGLLARGFDPMQAAETAAWLHVECARSFGPGLIAEDLPEELPKVFRELGL